jgi:hypothetical protein
MPYERNSGTGFERARRTGHVPTASDPAIAAALDAWQFPLTDPDAGAVDRCCHHRLPDTFQPDPLWLIALDGSNLEIPRQENHPSTLIGYLQISGVFVDLVALDKVGAGRFVDPGRLRAVYRDGVIYGVLPGANVTARAGGDGRDTFRAALQELFETRRVRAGGELSLLDILFCVHGRPGRPAEQITVGACPDRACSGRNIQVGRAGGRCPMCATHVWPTDVLRIARNEWQPHHPNGTAFSRVMTVCEHLAAFGYLIGMLDANPLVLSQGAFLLDGPLAVFGAPAPLRTQLRTFLQDVVADLDAKGLHSPLIVGVDKSGDFVDHARAVADLIPPGAVLHPDADYLDHRLLRRPNPDYGDETFYGRRFLYRSRAGDRTLVFSVPRLRSGNPYGGDPGAEDIDNFPTLAPVTRLLERIGTRLYRDATIPTVLAHERAALPLGTGADVLKILTREHLAPGHRPDPARRRAI